MATTLQQFQNFVGGEWVDAASGETFDSTSPADGETIGTFPKSGADDVDRAVAAAKEAYAETLRAVAEVEGIAAARAPELREMIVRRFTGPDYGWMWPFPRAVRRWIAEELDRIEAGATAS